MFKGPGNNYYVNYYVSHLQADYLENTVALQFRHFCLDYINFLVLVVLKFKVSLYKIVSKLLTSNNNGSLDVQCRGGLLSTNKNNTNCNKRYCDK